MPKSLFEGVQDFVMHPFRGDDDTGDFDIVRWVAMTAVTVATAFFVWHALRGHFE